MDSDARQRDDALVSVVLPVFNEVEVLRTLRASIEEVLAELDCRCEIVFVDDGSGDGSGPRLDEFAREDARIRVVHFSRNFGHQAAVQAGLEQARGDAVVVMDSDMQDDPRAITRFVERWRAGYDVVYAIRTDRKEGFVKRCLFSTFYRVLSAISEIPIPRDAGNFGLIDRRVVAAILRMGDGDRYYPGLRRWVGFRQTGVEVERLPRYDDQPRVSTWGLFRLARTAVFSFSRFPLTFFYVVSALGAVAGAASLVALLTASVTGASVGVSLPVVMAVSVLVSLNALGIAVLGEYVARIHDAVRRRPTYLLDDGAVDDETRPRATAVLESLNELYNTARPSVSESTVASHSG